MKRDLGRLEGERFDVLIAGGGIAGACVARDAALRGLRVALVEKDDFASGSSGANLKVVHGGFRYLKSFDLGRVRRSARELATWSRVAPHLVRPLPVLVPIPRSSIPGPAAYRLALRVYDRLARHARRDGPDPPGRPVEVPPAGMLSSRACRERVPWLDRDGLAGGVLFHDGLLYSPERAVLEVVESALRAGAVPINHAEVVEVGRDGPGFLARVRDGLGATELEVRSLLFVNATGAGAWNLARRLLGVRPRPERPTAVGVNLVLAVPPPEVAFAAELDREPEGALDLGRRHAFVVPWRGLTLVGTAYFPAPAAAGTTAPAGAPDIPGAAARAAAEERWAGAFLAAVRRSIPGLPATPADVRRVDAGLVPLRTGGTVGLEERPGLRDHAGDGVPGAVTVVTEKFTTARALAERATELLFRSLGRKAPTAATATTPLPGATGAGSRRPPAEIHRGAGLDADVARHLARTYGERVHEVLALGSGHPGAYERVCPEADVIRAQMYWGIEREMASTVDDLVERRTELGPRGLAAEARGTARRILEETAGAARPRDGAGVKQR